MIIHINSVEQFNEEIKQGKVLVDFFATWCGPCKMLSPILDEFESDRGDINVIKVDVDLEPELARSFGIMSVPTLILYKEGQIVNKQSGYMAKDELVEWINNSN